MIVSHLIGGLGNQMFQYAAGWALAKDKDTNLKLDVFDFENYRSHYGFEIDKVFRAEIDIATRGDLRDVLGWQSRENVNRILRRPRMSPIRKRSMVIEPHFHYFDVKSYAPSKAWLYGYWQSEKYFSSHANDLREQFKFRTPLSTENKVWLNAIKSKNSVSVHVRRGDFTNIENASIHGTCSLGYYKSAIQYIEDRVKCPEFFFFSDDMDWVKNNITTSYPVNYVENNLGTESYNDMRLMSECKFNIIANSSFSWWGAWLNTNAENIVIAPKLWFANDFDTSDLIPDRWIRI